MRRAVPIPLFLLLVIVSACGDSSNPSAASSNSAAAYSQTDIVVGTGTEAANGNTVTVQYQGWLYDSSKPDFKGNQFDAGILPPFVLGTSSVIAGFSRGIVGMRVGGTRRLIVPPDLGYGSAGAPPTIPPNATLVFEVTLINVR
jgi:FKBP-type peptidyl-prolyl cis-trans isomerase FkpA